MDSTSFNSPFKRSIFKHFKFLQRSGSRQAVVRQSSGSRQAVIRQLSGSRLAVIIRQLSDTHFISSSSDGVIIRLMLNKFKACFQSCFLTQFSALVLNPLHNSRFLDKFDLFSVLKSCSVNIV